MTSATERLRALLDERGIKWTEPSNDERSRTTHWTAGLLSCIAVEFNEGTISVSFTAHRVTPEQAIDATLGRGTCKVEESWHGESEMVEYRCTACDEYMVVEVVKPDGAQQPNYCPNCGRKVMG